MSPGVVAGASGDQTAAAAVGGSVDPSTVTCTTITPNNTMFLKHKRRYCRVEGCNSIVKSQGLCQRHGAKPKTCKVEGCTKQAQGNFDKMCKAHFKAMKRMTTPIPKVENTETPPPAQGSSVYDEILPKSLNFVDEDTRKMPLIVHLKDGFDTLKPPAWHRNEERRARGMFPIDNPAAQLEGWERELVWMEILVLTGVPGASFRHLARAWGRDKGFHMVLAQFICERHGDVERKKRHGERNRNKIGDSGACRGSNKKKRQKPNAKELSNQNNKIEIDNNNSNSEYNNGDIGANVWDPSLYGDVDTNEALAAEIFDFSEKEFERVVSKYKQGAPGDISVSTSADNNGRNISSSSTDVSAQAAMAAILGQQRTNPGHHRSHSMISSTSNGSGATNHNQEDIIPRPVNVETTVTVPQHSAIADHSQIAPVQIMNQSHIANHPNPGQRNADFTRVADTQNYNNHLTPLQGEAMYIAPQQFHQEQELMQQQMYQNQSQVQLQDRPMQVIAPNYQHQQPVTPSTQRQAQQEKILTHQIIQQQPKHYDNNAPTPLPQDIQPLAHAQTQVQTEAQKITQQAPTTLPPTQPIQQSGSHTQTFSQPISYAMPSDHHQQYQQQHSLASAPTTAQPTHFLPVEAPVAQHQQQQCSMDSLSYPQHKQDQLNPSTTQHGVNISYEQDQHQPQSYQTSLPSMSLPQQSHAASQQLVHVPNPHQADSLQPHQVRYTQTNIAPESSQLQIAPRGSEQHQLQFPMGEGQQIHREVQAQNNMSSLPQVDGQQIVHHAYLPQQQHEQEQTNQLMNRTSQESSTQDLLNVHHEIDSTQQDRTGT